MATNTYVALATYTIPSSVASYTFTSIPQGYTDLVLVCNYADGKFTLPSIVSTAPDSNDDPNQLNNLGATFTFVVVTAATDMDILTDGTDKFVGGVYTGVDDATGKTFISGATNDVITMNGTTKGGLVGSIVKCTAMATAKYAVEGIILGSGTLVTPFANA